MNKLIFGLPVTGIVLGTFIAILFGVNEGYFQSYINSKLENNPNVVQIQDVEKREAYKYKEQDKNWRYFQRFHFHSTGIGSMALALLLLLLHIQGVGAKLKTAVSLCISVGGFLYPFVWLFAAIYGPIIGRSAAKERFAIFGYMGGVFLLGAIGTLVLLLKNGLRKT